MGCCFVAEVNTAIAYEVAALHGPHHSAIIFIGIAFVGDRSITDEVEIFCFVLSISVMRVNSTKVAIEGCRDASHVTFVAKVLQLASFLMLEVLFGFGKPC